MEFFSRVKAEKIKNTVDKKEVFDSFCLPKRRQDLPGQTVD